MEDDDPMASAAAGHTMNATNPSLVGGARIEGIFSGVFKGSIMDIEVRVGGCGVVWRVTGAQEYRSTG